MAFKVSVDTRKLKAVGEIIEAGSDKKTAKKMARELVKLIKKEISKGISPITGKKYGGYRGNYRKRISDGKISGKSLTPVNLKVTGEFLKDLSAEEKRDGKGWKIVVGYSSTRSDNIESGLRDGKHNRNDKRKRPTLPTDQGENFSPKIQDALLEILVDELNKRIRRVNVT